DGDVAIMMVEAEATEKTMPARPRRPGRGPRRSLRPWRASACRDPLRWTRPFVRHCVIGAPVSAASPPPFRWTPPGSPPCYGPLSPRPRWTVTPKHPGAASFTRLCVFVNHVRDVRSGIHEYDQYAGELVLRKPGVFGAFLQANYLPSGGNLEQAAAVLVPLGRTHDVLDAVGDRGYHLVNAVVGAMAWAVHSTASAFGTGCGVALDFDSVSFADELGLAGRGEIPLLITMVGHERPDPADHRYDIVSS
ncbi:nitroreductase family protein, partial [Streptomyces aureus]|uniref:nitroreductase family protein n=1 Tax=Streptomyces aureus TaxID=193461 RepID=UPI0034042A0A